MKDSKVVIIPDVHGRTFWKEAVKDNENCEIVFLGDYLDPYQFEGISIQQALENFIEIVEFKKQHLNNVHLLIGNHDFAYIEDRRIACRHDGINHDTTRDLFLNNRNLFELTYHIKDVGPDNKLCIFSHAGILPINFLIYYYELVSETTEPNWSELFENKGKGYSLNEVFQGEDSDKRKWLFKKMNEVSSLRGGLDNFGSIIWADANEWQIMDLIFDELKNKGSIKDPRNTNIIQFFGHSQQLEEKALWLTPTACCLDCHRAFELNTKTGELTII